MNDEIEKCPRCGKKVCNHDERTFANLFAKLGTGVMNLDLSYRWVASLRDRQRVVIIELKRLREPMEKGQEITLMDLTGRLVTQRGFSFDLRSFVLERNGADFHLSTFLKTVGELGLTLVKVGDPPSCARIIKDWYDSGVVPIPVSPKTERYAFLEIDSCRARRHHFELISSPKTPLKTHLVCTTCTKERNQTSFVAFGEPHLSFGIWRENPKDESSQLESGV